jgi:hypothetical protein
VVNCAAARSVSDDPKYNGKAYWYLRRTDTPRTGVLFKDVVAKFRLPATISCDKGCMIQW